jgi:hypothetical protein
MLEDHHILEFLRSFSPISLTELDSFCLMNRVDTKYVFTSSRIPGILEKINKDFMTLEIDSERVFSYQTTYLDTPDWLFFRQHVKGRSERHKVRFRKYEQSGISFLEVKKRNNKLRTQKWRILKDLQSSDNFDEESINFIRKHVSPDTPPLNKILVNRFRRITLAGLKTSERVTIDFDLSFTDSSGKSIAFPDIGIIERKRFDFSNRSPLTDTLKKNSIYPTGFSKYCFGTALLYDIPGKNQLKPKILLLNKLQTELNISHHAR